MKIIFETERLFVRALEDTERDRDHFFALNSDEDVVRYIRPVKPREESDAFFKEVMEKKDPFAFMGRWLVFEKDSADLAGTFAVIPVEGKETIQMGYALLPRHWGKGYATELTKGGLEYVFKHPELDIIYAYAEKENIPSQKVLLKAGFKESGTQKEGDKVVVEFSFLRI